MYGHRDFNDFSRHVTDNYDCFEQDVYKMVMEEYETRLRESSSRKTPKERERLFQETLALCRSWLAEPRKQLTAQDIVSFRPAKNFFTAIQKK